MSSMPPSPENPDTFGAPPAALAPGSVPNHLAWAIVSTVVAACVCCIIGAIPGVVAIVYSNKVNGLLANGDLTGARRASDTAKTWCWVTTVLVVLSLLANVWSYTHGGPERYRLMMEQYEHAQGR